MTLVRLFTLNIILASATTFDVPALYQVTAPIDHGESPTWDDRTGLLYFVDVYDGRIMTFDPATSHLNAVQLEGTVSPVVPSKSNPDLLVVGVNRTVLAIEWKGMGPKGRSRKLTSVSEEYPGSRLNDGKADVSGRLWIGTMGRESATGVALDEGTLYQINRTNIPHPTVVLQPVNISNGMAWNRANDKFYYIDTFTFQVAEFDYDASAGGIRNRRVVFDVSRHKLGGFPDGMTIDKDDNLWIALMNGGGVVQVDPKSGRVLQTVAIPAQGVTSCSWGGNNLDVLFVTTSRHSLTEEQRLQQPGAGSLFAIKNLGTHGLPPAPVDLIDDII